MRQQVKNILIWLFVVRGRANKRASQRRIATIEELVDKVFLVLGNCTKITLGSIFAFVIIGAAVGGGSIYINIAGWICVALLFVFGLASKRRFRCIATRVSKTPSVVKGSYLKEARTYWAWKEFERVDFELREGTALGVDFYHEVTWVLVACADEGSPKVRIYYATKEEVEKLRAKLIAFFNNPEETEFNYDSGSISFLQSAGILLLLLAIFASLAYFLT